MQKGKKIFLYFIEKKPNLIERVLKTKNKMEIINDLIQKKSIK